MDFDAEHNPYEEGDTVAFGGEEQTHQLSSDRGGVEPFDNVDSADNEIKRSFDDHRDSSSGKLFVGGISWETNEETFTDYFSKYGEITDSVIMMDKHSGRPRGFGFVTFDDPAVTNKVLAEEHVIDGRAVEVKRTVPREDMHGKGVVSKTKKIFIGGIPPSFSEDELKEYFSTYGSIVEHQIMLDHKTGRSRGFGFVTFESEEAVEKIFSEGGAHELGGKQVEIKKAEPKRSGDYGGAAAKSYGGYANGAARYGNNYSSGGAYGGKMGRGNYSDYGGAYGGAYGGYGGNYGGGSAGFYGGFGGYGYGFGFGGPMYGGAGYASGGYGNPAGYGSAAAGYGGGRGYGGGGRGYGGGGVGGGGGYGNDKGYGSGSSMPGRYHPYRKQ